MASQLKVDTLTGVTTAGSIVVTGEGNSTTTNLQQGLAKAWVRYVTVSSTSIDDSLNCGSITDNGTGGTTISFSNNMGNANFAAGAIAGQDETFILFRSPATSSWTQNTANPSAATLDCARVGGIVMGDLA